MRIYLESEVPQGSAQWHAVRLGIPTASRCSDIVTPVKGELSKGRTRYAYQLIAERVLQEPMATDIGSLQWIVEGKEREEEARRMYAEITGAEPVRVGFVAADHGRWGCSPDCLVLGGGKRGAAEIKAPKETTQIGYLLDGPGDDYRPQTQMQMLVAGLEWNDFFSHHPRLPPVQLRLHPDEAYMRKIEAALATFADELDDMEKRVRAMGFFAPAPVVASDVDRVANTIIASPAKLSEIRDAITAERDDVLELALGTLPPEQRQRVREAAMRTGHLFA